MKIILILTVLSSFSTFSQTKLINHLKHYIALLDHQDSKILYNALDIEPVETEKGLVKTMGPEDHLVAVSCLKKDEIHSCYGMLKFYNLKDKVGMKNFFFVANVQSKHTRSWFNQLDIEEIDFGNGQFLKEFAAHDEGMYFNCRRTNNSKECRLGIRIE
jgi:hypothetical protein